MHTILRLMVVSAAALSGCAFNDVPDGRVSCSHAYPPAVETPGMQCPVGYWCTTNNYCYHDGSFPKCQLQDNCPSCTAGGASSPVIAYLVWHGASDPNWSAVASMNIALDSRFRPATEAGLAAALGSTDHLNTPDEVRAVLNDNLKGTFYDVINKADGSRKMISANVDASDVSHFDNDVRFDLIDAPQGQYPILVVVNRNGRPSCYPDSPERPDHWVVVIGSDLDGQWLLVADPLAESFGGSEFASVPRTFWLTRAEILHWMAGTIGYVA